MSIGILNACMQDNFSAIGKGPKSKPIAEQLPCIMHQGSRVDILHMRSRASL